MFDFGIADTGRSWVEFDCGCVVDWRGRVESWLPCIFHWHFWA